jgi:hypothetical protein
VPAAEAARLEGLYFDPSTLEIRRVERKDGGLFFRRGESAAPLRPNGSNSFLLRFGETELPIRFSPAGAPAQTMSLRQGGRDIQYYRTGPWTPAPGATELSGFVGDYESEEIGAIFRVALEGDRLMLHRRGADPTPLTPLFRDAFDNEDVGVMQFSRTALNTVPQFQISNGASRIPFRRRASGSQPAAEPFKD